MYEDNDIFELFQEIMEQVQGDDSDRRLRMLSKNPRYAADVKAAAKTKIIER